MSTKYFWPGMSRIDELASFLHKYSDDDVQAALTCRQEWTTKCGGGAVYLCLNNRNGYVKIGFSTNPTFREKTLQSEEPDVEFIAILPGTLADERSWHEHFKAKRVRGEWFDLTRLDVDEICEGWIPF